MFNAKRTRALALGGWCCNQQVNVQPRQSVKRQVRWQRYGGNVTTN